MSSQVSKCDIAARMRERILILDGAMGTMLQQFDLSQEDFRGGTGNNDILNLTREDVIESIHSAYIEAGADIIETNTFSSNAISQEEYGCTELVYQMNKKGAEIARRAAAGKDVFVAGSMGPTIRMLSMSPDLDRPEYRAVDFDTMVEAYKVQARGLIDGGADLFLVETVYDGLNAKAALYAIDSVQREKNSKLPVMVSATINDKSGRLLSGQQLEALYLSLSQYSPLSFGLNCSFGASDLLPFMEQMAGQFFGGKGVPCALSIYPNAGLPNEMGQYDETPQFTAAYIREMAQRGLLNIAGGCCGTTPEHIRAIKEALSGIAPRKFTFVDGHAICETSAESDMWLGGLEPLLVNREKNNFINVGERTNVAGSAKFAKLIRAKEYAQAAEIARKQIEDGATIIDINMDDAMLESSVEMAAFVRYISNDPDIAKVPFMIDSSDWQTILAGLKSCGGKPIVNSLSLKEGEEAFLSKAAEIRRLGAALIVMAFDEQGQAVTYQRKIEICSRAYRLLTEKLGFDPADIIFDVNILTIATGLEEHDNYAVDYIEAVRWIKANLPGAKCSGGVSNLSFAFRGNNRVREAMHSVFLYHAIKAGLDMAIVNPSMLQVYDDIDQELLRRVEAVVLNDIALLKEKAGDYSSPTEALVELAEKIKEEEIALKAAKEAGDLPKTSEKVGQWRTQGVDERLSYALIKGITTYMGEDIAEALESYGNPVSIIEGPLMRGMDRVGSLFGEGKMFLPQVVKSAKAMKAAVSLLQPKIEELNSGAAEGVNRGRIVLATAKGDVHDIGKNIVGIVLACNNFEVIDLGVMVDNSTILEEAIRNRADIICISGLITPSLEHMEALCRLLEEENERIVEAIGHPLVLNVGGATTSALHTAVKLAPLYSNCVVYGGDASTTVGICKRVMQELDSRLPAEDSFFRRVSAEQEKIRKIYYNRNIEFLSDEEALAASPDYKLESYLQPGEYGENNLIVKGMEVNRLIEDVDWTPFFNFWGFKGKYPNLLYTSEESGEEADKLFQQAMDEIAEVAVNNEFEISAVVKFYDAYSAGNEICLLENYEEDPDPEDSEAFLKVRSESGEEGLMAAVNGRRVVAKMKMARQRDKGSRHLSVADYFPAAPYTSKVGALVVKVEDLRAGELDKNDFKYLLRQSLCARFTEAMAQWVTRTVSEEQNIVRAAFGYPMVPDYSQKRIVFDLTDAENQIGAKLTESFAIVPSTSICALLIAHKEAVYFDIKSDK